jgi:hypothetical protein
MTSTPAGDEFPVFPQTFIACAFVRLRRCVQLGFMSWRDALLMPQVFQRGIGARHLHFLHQNRRPERFSQKFPNELANVGMAYAKPSGQGASGLLRSGGDVPPPNEMLDSLASLWRSPVRTSLLGSAAMLHATAWDPCVINACSGVCTTMKYVNITRGQTWSSNRSRDDPRCHAKLKGERIYTKK